ncbi:ABC transporter ATP-binding protein [uncultured Modestobacter sp.]|uniref:ABC transporter ATP-binding protein n=1 Tax=uncultured Modestobacter sp. TaxID=380048 RepID=UPI00262EEEA3|nr:ATP-binding cassette domain-containing protein [uncultured Modestobacter sp.]
MLEVRGVRKAFGDVTALDDLSFEVRPGEIYGFVGANGAGKTTAMRVVLGVTEPDAGSVTWRGRSIGRRARRRIGYMPEERGLYPAMRVRAQLAYLAELHGRDRAAARRAADSWLARLGVTGKDDARVQTLSLGNQQRVQLAAALVHDPELLVLDEPFSGLDPVAVDVMSEVLTEQAAAGVPVIFSSHQLELVERTCDRVGIIAGGRMRASGTIAELQSTGLRQFWLDAPGFVPDQHGVTPIRTVGTARLLAVDDTVDERALLSAALAVGPVREFRPHRPSLTDLYRETVAADLQESAAGR